MTLERISVSLLEPVSVSEMKVHLRLDHDEEDILLGQMITAARMYLENKLSLAFLSARWRYRPQFYLSIGKVGGTTLYAKSVPFPINRQASIKMPLFPIFQLHHIRLYLNDGTTALADLSPAKIESAKRPAYIKGLTLPFSVQREYGAEIEFTAGYGTAAQDVPSPLRLAIKMLAAHFYENRIDSISCQSASLPATVSLLLMDYMEVRLK